MSTYSCFLVLLATVVLTPRLLISDSSPVSWVESANDVDCGFSLNNLPYGVFSTLDQPDEKRIGVAIGDRVLDLKAWSALYEASGVHSKMVQALRQPTLNALMALGCQAGKELRHDLQKFLSGSVPNEGESFLLSRDEVITHLPVSIGDYTDFYTSKEHATNVGKVFRPDNPLVANFKHLPMGYHGRASSVVISGTDVHRPWGQLSNHGQPVHRACERLDYEMEMGVFLGKENKHGSPIPMREVREHLFGMVILNDWSARDIQRWEMTPLGPFNSKNFATSISAWVVPFEALEPYLVAGPPRASEDPATLSYLQSDENFALDIVVEVYLRSAAMIEQGMDPVRISQHNASSLYWTIAQMLVQHSCAGCNMQVGDLYGTGTISGEPQSTRGCLLEHSLPGTEVITLSDGSTRGFLQDGDEVVMRAYTQKEGLPKISFGECVGRVLPAVEASHWE